MSTLMTESFWQGNSHGSNSDSCRRGSSFTEELVAEWELAVNGENPYKIAPL
jgi:hypothetical protein